MRHRGGYIFALWRGNLFERRNSDSGLLRERLGGGGGLAILKGDVPGRTGHLLGGIGLADQHSAHLHSEAARRGVAVNFVLLAQQTLAAQQCDDTLGQLLFGGGDHARRNFFQSCFEKQLRHGYAAPNPSFCAA